MTILARFHLNTPSADLTFRKRFRLFFTVATVCTENLIRVDDVMESPKLAE
jgi:hypothetical protein